MSRLKGLDFVPALFHELGSFLFPSDVFARKRCRATAVQNARANINASAPARQRFGLRGLLRGFGRTLRRFSLPRYSVLSKKNTFGVILASGFPVEHGPFLPDFQTPRRTLRFCHPELRERGSYFIPVDGEAGETWRREAALGRFWKWCSATERMSDPLVCS